MERKYYTTTRKKIPLGIDVLTAAKQRVSEIFEDFERVCISFSGGKDSTVLFHIVAQEARNRDRKFDVLFVDWEVQYSATIQHVENMKISYSDCVSVFYHVCLPMTTVNGVSAIDPEWTSWQPGITWVRLPPQDAITDPAFFNFYRHGMTFECFIKEFNIWFANGGLAANLIGIRTDESLNRFLAVCSVRKKRLSIDKPWTTQLDNSDSYTAYPLYDWRVTDIWRFHANTGLPYNPIYDLMLKAGVSLSAMRICEPFGPEQRKGLWLFHILDPQTWSRACHRVSGATSGARYVRNARQYFGQYRIEKPSHHSWQSYAYFLLDSLPESTAEHYRTKFAIYLKWYKDRNWPEGIPDTQKDDLGSRDVPSWRRICKVLLRNDYWCRSLSFSPTKKHNYQRYMERLKLKRKQWDTI